MADLIERHFATASQVDVLLLMHAQPDRLWDGAAVGKELRIDDVQAEQMLSRLARHGLLRRSDDAYRYAPKDDRLSEAIDALAELYPTYRVAIVSLIFSRPRGPIRDFSEAFRLREKD